ncbi:MAG: Fe-S cluster assembly ATPase SufC [Acidimicrobiia bacterium]|nr:Fe-S cluster assembly ATPase SufC [Acidimicrobiia bacterium]NNF10110.1 Fe-S cluster assembly ATPase SufC [Acidimicrobiia bacterium]NNL68584.1 Fe-S cluster assembly ATPase SufC [Acidimicrobiia bacterium]
MEPILTVSNLHVSVEGTPILNGIDLEIPRGKIHAVMGPNGSGKSTLANVLMGNPAYEITQGSIVFKGKELVEGDDWTDEQVAEVTPTQRGKSGMFLAFQYPEEIPGVTIVSFLRQALSNRTGVELTVLELRLKVADTMRELGMDPSFADRYLNEGFSGGERKRNEVLQMAVLEPELAIMDETDSGLDIDALKVVADGVNRLRAPERSFLVITHYQRLLEYITPDVVHILLDGRIVETGGPELAAGVEGEGYEAYRAAVGG